MTAATAAVPFVDGAAVAPFGDAAVVAEVGDNRRARALAAVVERQVAGTADPPAVIARPRGIREVVPGYTSVLVQFDPRRGDADEWRRWLTGVVGRAVGDATTAPPTGVPFRTLDVPVRFDGEDLEAVTAASGLSGPELVAVLCATELEVAFLGFSPGFPYLTGLPPPLAAVTRRATPRTIVPAGSVAVAGGFAAVYPHATPGGWHLLGRTTVTLFDPERPPYAVLRAGDRVRFRVSGPGDPDPSAVGAVGGAGGDPSDPRASNGVPAGAAGNPADTSPPAGPRTRPGRPALDATGSRVVDVVEPGLLSMIQDEGRTGVAGVGVPPAGAADPDTFRLANRLVGNDDGAAAIEVTARGPTLAFGCDTHVAVVAAGGEGGVTLWLDGHGVPDGTVLPVRSGQVLTVGTVGWGLRAYIGLAGGVELGRVVGSRSSDRLCGLGPGPLQAGDRLALGASGMPHGRVSAGDELPRPGTHVLRVLPGPHRFAPGELARFTGRPWTVGRDSDRVGVRLEGELPVAPPAAGVPSIGMVTGAVQVPPDGGPIVLLPDHATVGGYPVLCCVVTADSGRLGRLGPGDTVVFEEVTLAEAVALGREHERRLARRVTGWYPTAAGT